MPPTLALVGGDEFRPHCQEMDTALLQAAGRQRPRVVILPAAAAHSGPQKAATDGVAHFNRLGANAESLLILTQAQANDPNLVQRIAPADLIYLTGGSPDHHLQTLRDTRLLTAITDALAQGTILAGSSAGAMVIGTLMRRPSTGQWIDALALAPGIAVLPHHENRDPAQLFPQLQTPLTAGLTILGIDAQTGLLGHPGHWQAVGYGQVTVYRPAGWQTYPSGATITAADP